MRDACFLDSARSHRAVRDAQCVSGLAVLADVAGNAVDEMEVAQHLNVRPSYCKASSSGQQCLPATLSAHLALGDVGG